MITKRRNLMSTKEESEYGSLPTPSECGNNIQEVSKQADDEQVLRDEQALSIQEAIWKKTGRESRVVFELMDDLNDIAITGRCIFTYPYLDIDKWAPGLYRSPIMDNPTWLDFAVVADEAVHTAKDFHHCFAEGFSENGYSAEGIPMYELDFGS
jgi:hypothetical protein